MSELISTIYHVCLEDNVICWILFVTIIGWILLLIGEIHVLHNEDLLMQAEDLELEGWSKDKILKYLSPCYTIGSILVIANVVFAAIYLVIVTIKVELYYA